MDLTKKNGRKIAPSSKKHKFRKLKPKTILSTYKKTGKVTYLNEIYFKEGTELKKERMLKILIHPIASYKTKKYLTVNTIVQTESSKHVKVCKVNRVAPFVYGTLVS